MTARALETDPVLAAMAAAPLVPLTPEEEALLAEVDFNGPWIPHDEFMAALASRPHE